MDVMISILFGGTPNWTMLSSLLKSFIFTSKLPKPKSIKAAIKLDAFVSVGSIQKSISPVYLGYPYKETA